MQLKITQRNIRELKPSSKPYDVYDTKLDGFVARVQKSGTISYLLAYDALSGKSRNYTIGRDGYDGMDATTARTEAEKLKTRVKAGADPQLDRQQEKVAARNSELQTLQLYIDSRYKKHHLPRRKAASATEALRMITANFRHLLDKPLAAITTQQVEAWQLAQAAKSLSPQTTRRIRAELESLINHAVRDGWLNDNPLKKLAPIRASSSDNVKPRYLSPEENARLLAALTERDSKLRARAESGRQWRLERGYEVPASSDGNRFIDYLEPMVLLSLKTGMRRGELFSLEWSDIDDSEINLRGENTKSRKPRSIPLNKLTQSVLADWRAQTSSAGLVFQNGGKPFNNVKRAWASLLKSAEIKEFRWHDMRHDFASQLVIKGVPLNTVRELMGHSSIQMTLRYAHLSSTAKSDAVALLG